MVAAKGTRSPYFALRPNFAWLREPTQSACRWFTVPHAWAMKAGEGSTARIEQVGVRQGADFESSTRVASIIEDDGCWDFAVEKVIDDLPVLVDAHEQRARSVQLEQQRQLGATWLAPRSPEMQK